MSGNLEASVQLLLRSSEELRLVLDAEAIHRPTDSDSPPVSSSSSDSDFETDSSSGLPGSYSASDKRRQDVEGAGKRVLAIVTHVDPYGEEQGW